MKKHSVYLAGPITGQTYKNAIEWRDQVTPIFNSCGIECFSPLRAKTYLNRETAIADSYSDIVMSSQRGIYARDFYDCRSKDAIFINLLNTNRVSIGTVMEIAWGAAFNKPMVLVIEKENNLHDHAMIREACPLTVNTLEDGIHLMKSLLLPVGH